MQKVIAKSSYKPYVMQEYFKNILQLWLKVINQVKKFGNFFSFIAIFIVYNFTSIWNQRVHQRKGKSWRTNCPLILATWHKFDQGDHVRSLHELSKSVRVGERGKAKQKHSLTFCVFRQTKNKCSSSFTFPKSQPRQCFSAYGTFENFLNHSNFIKTDFISFLAKFRQ